MQPTNARPRQQNDQRSNSNPNQSPTRTQKSKNRRFKKYKENPDNQRGVHNLSTKTLNQHHYSVLQRGLSFVPTPRRPNQIHVLRDILLFNRRVRLKHFFQSRPSRREEQPFPKEETGWQPPNGLDMDVDSLTNHMITHMSKPTRIRDPCSNLNPEEMEALHDLCNDDSIIIKPADKGGAIVVLNKQDYIKEGYRQLNNKSHYTKLPYDITTTNAHRIQKTITRLCEEGRLPKVAENTLLPKNIRTSPFYMLPKIHKPNNPGRPIVSGIDSPTDIISQILDMILKPQLKHIPSYIKDTWDFLRIVETIGHLHEDEILVTIDVSSLYTSIPHEDGLEAIHTALTDHPSPHIDADTATYLARMVLENNSFAFNDEYFLQTQGTAMGTKMAPTYANIFMDQLERKILAPQELQPNIWKRFIDDIFAIYRCTDDEITDHLDALNRAHPTIKFTMEYSRHSINFLDTTVYVGTNRRLETKLYTKPTDAHLYLDYTSHHPQHQRDAIAFSQSVRIRTICSEINEFDKSCLQLLKNLTLRGHPHQKIKAAIARARSLNRTDLLKEKTADNKLIIPLILEYNPQNLRANRLVKQAWNYITNKPRNDNLDKNKIITAYRRPANLRDLLCPSSLSNRKPQHGSKPCMRFSCTTCINIVTTKSFKAQNKKEYRIIGNNTCQTRSVVYSITCPVCNQTYIGETGRTIHERIRDHKYDLHTRKRHLPIPAHMLDHDVQANEILVTILDSSSKSKNNRLRLEEAWIRTLNTMTPFGLNQKL